MLGGDRNLPVRLLGTGMLLACCSGAVRAGRLTDLSWWEPASSPASWHRRMPAWARVIVTSLKVPPRIRQALERRGRA